MWFTESESNKLGRIARDGRITKFELPDEQSYPSGIVGRSDGRLFVALLNRAKITYTDLAAAEPTRTATPIPTPTVRSSPGITGTPSPSATVPPGSTATATPTDVVRGCHGDCNGDGMVSISELIGAVNIALGNAAPDTCVNADADGSGEVLINDLIAAVNAALGGCAP